MHRALLTRGRVDGAVRYGKGVHFAPGAQRGSTGGPSAGRAQFTSITGIGRRHIGRGAIPAQRACACVSLGERPNAAIFYNDLIHHPRIHVVRGWERVVLQVFIQRIARKRANPLNSRVDNNLGHSPRDQDHDNQSHHHKKEHNLPPCHGNNNMTHASAQLFFIYQRHGTKKTIYAPFPKTLPLPIPCPSPPPLIPPSSSSSHLEPL